MNIYFSILGLALLLNLIGFFWLVVNGFKRSVVWGLLVFLFSPLSAVIFAATNWFDTRKPFLVYLGSLLLAIGIVVYMYTEVGGANLQKLSARLQTGEISMAEATRLLDKAMQQSGPADLFAEETPSLPADAAAADAEVRTGLHATAAAVTDAAAVQTDADEAPAATETEVPVATETDAPPAQAAAPEEAAQGAAGEAQTEKAAQEPVRPSYPTPGSTVPDPLAVPKPEREENSIAISLHKVGGYIGRYLILDMKNGTQQRGFLTRADAKSLMLNRKLYGGSMEYRVYTSQVKTVHVLKKGTEPNS